jgi:hypothetical protein
LPPNPAEENEIYFNRIKRSRFKRVFRDAIKKDYSGLLSRINYTDIPLSFEKSINNVDLIGSHATTFFKKADEFALRDGSCFILVEYPKSELNITLAEQSNDKPYLVLIERQNLINWKAEIVDGEMRFIFSVIVEKTWQDVGIYGQEQVTRYRVLNKGYYQIFEKIEKNDQVSFKIEEGQTGLTFVPLVGYCLTETNAIESDFPLKDLADLNLELYQLHSEKREMIHNTVPTLQINEREEFQTNSNTQKRAIVGHHSILWNVDAEWIEPSGNGITPTQLEEDKLLNEINQETLGFLSGNFTPRTATEVELDASQSIANLEGLAINKESCINNVLRYWSLYDGIDFEGSVDVEKSLLKPAKNWTVQDVLDATAQGLISQNFGLLILEKNGLLDQFSQDEIDKERIVNEFTPPAQNQQVLG